MSEQNKTTAQNGKRRIKERTYYAPGLLELTVMIPLPVGEKRHIAVEFTGGHITGYGVSPATFTTKDPYIQDMLESNRWFGRKIFLEKDESKSK